MNNTDQITLNVGGTLFTTTRGTLLKYRGTVFQSLLGNERPWKMRDIFMDRDPVLFSHILNFMRGYSLSVDRDLLRQLYEDAVYYSVDPLVETLRAQLGIRTTQEEVVYKKSCLERLFALRIAYEDEDPAGCTMDTDTEEIESNIRQLEQRDEDKTIELQATMIMHMSPILVRSLCPAIERYFGINLDGFSILNKDYHCFVRNVLRHYREQNNIGPVGVLMLKFATDAWAHSVLRTSDY